MVVIRRILRRAGSGQSMEMTSAWHGGGGQHGHCSGQEQGLGMTEVSGVRLYRIILYGAVQYAPRTTHKWGGAVPYRPKYLEGILEMRTNEYVN